MVKPCHHDRSIDKVDMPDAGRGHVPVIQTAQNTVEVSHVPFLCREVDVLGVIQQQGPVTRKVQRTLDISQLRFKDDNVHPDHGSKRQLHRSQQHQAVQDEKEKQDEEKEVEKEEREEKERLRVQKERGKGEHQEEEGNEKEKEERAAGSEIKRQKGKRREEERRDERRRRED